MSLAPVNPQVAERDSVRQQLANMRLDMEANVVNTTTAFTAAGFAESVDLQVAYMHLLMYFIKIGGRVLACPVYHTNCTPNETRLRTRKIGQLVRFVSTYPEGSVPEFFPEQVRQAGVTINVDWQAVRQKDGKTKHLVRLNSTADAAQCGDPEVWKWLFCDLRETENLSTRVTEKARWCYCGQFGLAGYDLAVEAPAPPAGAGTPNTFMIS